MTGAKRSRLLLVLFGTGIAIALFALAELTLRVLDVGAKRELLEFPADDEAVLTREPNWPLLRGEARQSLDRIATPRTKREGTFRVIVVGESTVAGFPFYPRLSFGRLLEASLRDALPGLEIEIVNFGRAADPSDAVARTAIESLAAAPDVLVVCSGHNEYQSTYVDDLRDGTWARVRASLRKLRLARMGFERALGQEAPRPALADGRLVGEAAYLSPSEFARGETRFRENLESIVAAASERAVDVVFVTPVSNLRDFAPCYSHYTRKLSDAEELEYERLLRELDAALEATVVPADAERMAVRLRDLDNGVARAAFLAAKLCERAGRMSDAAALFGLALEEDGYPNRARAALNLVVRQVAGERGMRLVDANHAFAAAARGAVPGADLFLDHCHPTLEGMALLADAVRPAVVELLVRRGAAVPASYRERPMLTRAPIDEWLSRISLTRDAVVAGAVRAGQGSLLMHLGLPANREALELARRAFDEALRIAPAHVDARQGLLCVELLEGRREAALALAGPLAAEAPEAMRKVEEVSKQFEPLRSALERLGLRLESGRLVDR